MAEENAWREELTSVENRFKVERALEISNSNGIFESGEANEEETQQARLVEILRSLTITSSALIFFPRTRSPRDDDEISTFRTFPLN